MERSNRGPTTWVDALASRKVAPQMLWLLLLMVLVLIVATLVVVYVAYPHRGAQVPGVPVVGDVMTSAARAIPVLDADDMRERATSV